MSKRKLIFSVLQIVIGIAAIIAYIVLAFSGEGLGRWTVTLLLAVYLVVLGVQGVVAWKKSK